MAVMDEIDGEIIGDFKQPVEWDDIEFMPDPKMGTREEFEECVEDYEDLLAEAQTLKANERAIVMDEDWLEDEAGINPVLEDILFDRVEMDDAIRESMEKVEAEVATYMKDEAGLFGPRYRELNTMLKAFKNDPPFYEKELLQFKSEKEKLEQLINSELMMLRVEQSPVKAENESLQQLQ